MKGHIINTLGTHIFSVFQQGMDSFHFYNSVKAQSLKSVPFSALTAHVLLLLFYWIIMTFQHNAGQYKTSKSSLKNPQGKSCVSVKNKNDTFFVDFLSSEERLFPWLISAFLKWCMINIKVLKTTNMTPVSKKVKRVSKMLHRQPVGSCHAAYQWIPGCLVRWGRGSAA